MKLANVPTSAKVKECSYNPIPQYDFMGYFVSLLQVCVGPCHHDMARPRVADRGTASDKEGSCE